MSCLFLVSYLIIYLHFLVRSFELPNSFYYISSTDSDFVDPDCLKLVSSVQYLSPPTSLPAVKVSIFPQEI